ncbi:MAG: hypothetical protein JWO43_410 [Candidatus Adlerbacteria bacterium]|nr:hypothetical protein [Candidatus Adlerbacteria bacterium]
MNKLLWTTLAIGLVGLIGQMLLPSLPEMLLTLLRGAFAIGLFGAPLLWAVSFIPAPKDLPADVTKDRRTKPKTPTDPQ